MTVGNTAQRKARYLALPSLVVALYAIPGLPWLLDTRHRLQSNYWEAQLLFAFVVLAIAACGVPFVFLRLFRRLRVLSVLGWVVVALGYLGLVTYMIQSHYPPVTKLACVAMGLACMRWSIEGLILDLKGNEWSLHDTDSVQSQPESCRAPSHLHRPAEEPPVSAGTAPAEHTQE